MALLRWALLFAVIAIVAGILGFTEVAGDLAEVARVLFYIFLAGVAILIVAGIFLYRKAMGPTD